jgi:hypothetical protein
MQTQQIFFKSLEIFVIIKMLAIDKQSVVSVKHLNYYFGHGALRRRILSDINLEIRPQEMLFYLDHQAPAKLHC